VIILLGSLQKIYCLAEEKLLANPSDGSVTPRPRFCIIKTTTQEAVKYPRTGISTSSKRKKTGRGLPQSPRKFVQIISNNGAPS
jgi:hypothetical protein